MDEQKRMRVERQEWAKRVERWRDSGLTTAEFTVELGINPRTLTYWAWTLKREASGKKRVWSSKKRPAARAAGIRGAAGARLEHTIRARSSRSTVAHPERLRRAAAAHAAGSSGDGMIPAANLSMGNIARFLVPLPPLAEQRRIVAKLDQLMKLCDDLEAKLRRAEDRASKLVEAVVQEVVSGTAGATWTTPPS
jgi:hypothetical protein